MLNNLINLSTIDSKEIAKMIEMRHGELLRKIANFNDILYNAKLRSTDYFIPDTYKASNGETNPCYRFTKMGCEFIANKFNGEKELSSQQSM